MSKCLVLLFLTSCVALTLAGYANHDVTLHPGYGGYGHGVSVRHDFRHPGYHAYVPYAAGAAPHHAYGPAAYGGYGLGYGHGIYGYGGYPGHYW